jgi:hypothetical protein
MMTNIEVNLAGFRFTWCMTDVAGRHAWHVSRMHHLPLAGRFGRRRATHLRVA